MTENIVEIFFLPSQTVHICLRRQNLPKRCSPSPRAASPASPPHPQATCSRPPATPTFESTSTWPKSCFVSISVPSRPAKGPRSFGPAKWWEDLSKKPEIVVSHYMLFCCVLCCCVCQIDNSSLPISISVSIYTATVTSRSHHRLKKRPHRLNIFPRRHTKALNPIDPEHRNRSIRSKFSTEWRPVEKV